MSDTRKGAPEPLHGKDAYQNSDGGDDLVHRIRMQLGRANAAALGTREDVLRAALGGLHIVASEAVAAIETAQKQVGINAQLFNVETERSHGLMKRAEKAECAAKVRSDQFGDAILAKHAASVIKSLSLDKMVDRFLAWPLPDSVRSDTCVTMVGGDLYRSGTNLLTADEARQMLGHVVYGK